MIHANDLRHQIESLLTQARHILDRHAKTDRAHNVLRYAWDTLAHNGDAREFRRTLASYRHQLDPDAYGDLIPNYLRILTLRRQLRRAELQLLAA